MRHLAQTGPLLVSEACAHFDRSQAATSDIFKRLEARGLVSRMSDERDRRRTLTWLTDEGLKMIAESDQALAAGRIALALSRMTEDDRRSLIEGLRYLADHAE